MPHFQYQRDTLPTYEIDTDPARLDFSRLHRFLSQEAYWSRGIPRDLVERALRGSLSWGVYHRATEQIPEQIPEQQVGFARVVTDGATFAWLCDVYIEQEHRGQGLSKWLVSVVMAHPQLQDLRRFMLATADAHPLSAFWFLALSPGPRTGDHPTQPLPRASSVRGHLRLIINDL